MSRVIVNFLSLCMLFAASKSWADFAQDQVRYFSYFDIVNNLKRFGETNHECTGFTQDNSAVFGYSSTVSGSPSSSVPNFDFLNKYFGCLEDTNIAYGLDEFYERNVSSTLYRNADLDNLTPGQVKLVKDLIDEATLRLIGPETVVASYGYVSTQGEFTKIIFESSLEMSKNEDASNLRVLVVNAIRLIHLRDEYLSY